MISEVRSTSITSPAHAVTGVPGVREESGQRQQEPKGKQRGEVPAGLTTLVTDVVRELSDLVKMLHTNLEFSVDEKTKKIIVKVMDADTQKVIRQIPPEEMMRISARVQELLGVLIDGTA